ncbi:MAG: hypothetical protein MAG458_01483 [Nitrosopumilus sp.]|nr:hypothetical protein [Nitrosopumilus sp.]
MPNTLNTSMKKKLKINSVAESLLIFLVMTAIFLPVRLIFVAYFSDDWFGSFGIIFVISIVMIILIKKNKLGWFGNLFERKLAKVQYGKKAILVYGQAIFFVLILGSQIYTVQMGHTQYLDIKNSMLSHQNNLNDLNYLVDNSDLDTASIVNSILSVPSTMVNSFPIYSASMAIVDDAFDGWLIHMYTVGLAESIEIIGIMLFYRFVFVDSIHYAKFYSLLNKLHCKPDYILSAKPTKEQLDDLISGLKKLIKK